MSESQRFGLAVCLLLASCSRVPSVPAPAKTAADMPGDFTRLEHEYAVYGMARFPVMATYLGSAAFDPALTGIDGKLRDHSAEALEEEDARWRYFRDRFVALKPEMLTAGQRTDREVALAQIEFLLHQHQVRRYQERALDSYVDEPFRGIDWHIQGMTQTGPATYGTDEEWRHLIERVRAVPAFLATAERQLAQGVVAGNTPDWRVLRQFGLKSTLADAEYFEKTLPALARTDMLPAGRDALAGELQSAGHEAAAAYRHLREFLVGKFFDDLTRDGPMAVKPQFRADRFALGEAEYDWALRNNLRVTRTAAQLYEESWPVVQRTRAAMIELARQIAIDHKWRAPADEAVVPRVLEKLSHAAPRTDAQALELYRKTGKRLVDYARRTGLFEVPTDYRLDVTFTPPPLRASSDGAAYYPAPPFKQSGVGRFYVNPTDNDPVQLAACCNRAAVADLAAHEGFPGHDWDYKVMTRYRGDIAPVRWLTPGGVEDSSSMWEDSMAAEGWALYAEALLAEPQPGAPEGFYTPEERLYQLQGQLYRDLRVRIDTGLHTGRIPFDVAVTLFSQVVDFLPGSCGDIEATSVPAKRASCASARSAIDRYARWPTQAITYRLGKEEILALRAKAAERLGASFSLQRFHLELMKQGTIPVGYFGDELLARLQGQSGR